MPTPYLLSTRDRSKLAVHSGATMVGLAQRPKNKPLAIPGMVRQTANP